MCISIYIQVFWLEKKGKYFSYDFKSIWYVTELNTSRIWHSQNYI